MLTALYILGVFAMLASCCSMVPVCYRDSSPDLIDWAHIVLVGLLWPFALVVIGLLILATMLSNIDRFILPRATR